MCVGALWVLMANQPYHKLCCLIEIECLNLWTMMIFQSVLFVQCVCVCVFVLRTLEVEVCGHLKAVLSSSAFFS